MPKYRSDEYDEHRRPMRSDEQERSFYEPERENDEKDMRENWRFSKKPCRILFPFRVEVKVIPLDDHDHKPQQYR